MIEIISKRDGFRRCGVAHPKVSTSYPDGFFTARQIDELVAEPMLVVDMGLKELPECVPEEDREDRGIFELQTVKDLKASLDQLGIEYPGTARKQDLIDLIMLNTARVPEE